MFINGSYVPYMTATQQITSITATQRNYIDRVIQDPVLNVAANRCITQQSAYTLMLITATTELSRCAWSTYSRLLFPQGHPPSPRPAGCMV
jgi:hypothetical protein